MDGNHQALCSDCHKRIKAREEAKPQKLPLYVQCTPAWSVVISGPPASGKSTEAKRIQHERGGIIYDLDDIAQDIGLPRYDRTWEQAKLALHHRNFRMMRHPSTHGLILVQSYVTVSQRAILLSRLNVTFTAMTTAMSVIRQRQSDRAKGGVG